MRGSGREQSFGCAGIGTQSTDADRAGLGELCDRIDACLDAGDRHEAHRLTVLARNLARQVYGATPVTLKPNGGRSWL